MKITEFPSVKDLDPSNMFLIDGPGGTKIIYAPDLVKQLLKIGGIEAINEGLKMDQLDPVNISAGVSLDPSDMLIIGNAEGNKSLLAAYAYLKLADLGSSHPSNMWNKRNVWGNSNLGSVVTDEQWGAIKDGTFKGLMLGDYWRIGNRIWRIVDFDYWNGFGDTACRDHHVVIMPDKPLYNHKMNDTNSTAGGYQAARSSGGTVKINEDAVTMIYGDFGSEHLLKHRGHFTNAVTNGYPSGGAWYDSWVEIPNEIMIYGCQVFTAKNNGSVTPSLHTIDDTQLAGMAVCRGLINPSRESYWLRDVVSSAHFANVHGNGYADSYAASSSLGVRPVFGLIG